MKSRFVLLVCAIIFNISLVLSFNTVPAPVHSFSTKFEPEVASKTCLLKPDEGPCRAVIRMYYFDPLKKQCDTFNWGGCQGNGNRFDKRSECENSCLTQPGSGKKRPRYCHLTFDYGFCFGAVKRWYYDRMWKVCKETIYSGCGGNKNNFYSYEQCDSICRLAKGSLTSVNRIRSGVRKVVYVFTNVTHTTKQTEPAWTRTRPTSPQPRSRT